MDYLHKIEALQHQVSLLATDLDSLRNLSPSGTDRKKSGEGNARVIAYLALGEQSEDDLLNMILRCAMYVVRAGGAGLTILDQTKNKLVFRAAVGDGAEGVVGYDVPLEGSLHGLAFATGEIQSSTTIHYGAAEKTGVSFRNVLVAPLVTRENVIGTISAVNKQDADHFSADDMAAYQFFSELAAQVVQQRLREDAVRNIFSGDISSAPADLAAMAVGNDEILLMEVLRNVVQISRRRPAMLEVCKQLTASLLSVSTTSAGRNG